MLLILPPAQALAFIAVHQAVFGLYMGCSFAPNHKGMPIIAADEKVDYLRRQVLTSRNVRGGWLVDQLLGGLNYQIEHHLFPNMPRQAPSEASCARGRGDRQSLVGWMAVVSTSFFFGTTRRRRTC